MIESHVLRLETLFLLLGPVQFSGDVASLSQLLLQSALDDCDVLLDPGDVRGAELTRAWNTICEQPLCTVLRLMCSLPSAAQTESASFSSVNFKKNSGNYFCSA